MNIRVSSLAILVMLIALMGCSSDDKSHGDDTQSSTVAPDTTSQDAGTMQSPESTTSTVATPPAEEPAPIPSVETEPAPAPEPMAATPEPDTTEAVPDAAPTQHIVKGVVTQWAPLVLFVKPGDQVVFRQMTGHDTETLEGMIPEGAETWKSKLGAEGFAVSPSVPGIYMYKCNPHVSLGMIGAIAVGDPPYANLAAIEAHPQNKGMIGRAIRKLKQALDNREGT